MTRPALLALVAHEDATTRDAARDALRWDGCEVVVASSSSEALERASASAFDVAVLSAAIANAAADQLRANALARTPIVALGVHGGSARSEALLREPVDALELIALVRLVAAR